MPKTLNWQYYVEVMPFFRDQEASLRKCEENLMEDQNIYSLDKVEAEIQFGICGKIC